MSGAAIADLATEVIDVANREHGRLTPAAILKLAGIRRLAQDVDVQLAQIRQLHDEWGSTDLDDVDQLTMWERLRDILGGKA